MGSLGCHSGPFGVDSASLAGLEGRLPPSVSLAFPADLAACWQLARRGGVPFRDQAGQALAADGYVVIEHLDLADSLDDDVQVVVEGLCRQRL